MPVFYPNCRVVLSVVFDGFGAGGSDSLPTILGKDEPLIPRTASVHLNGYKDAGWDLELDAKRFPFSPEIIRSVAAQIYMFGTEGLDDDPQRYLADEKYMLTAGLADDDDITYSKDGHTLHLSGRDYTGLLIDRKWNPKTSGVDGRVPVGGDLTETVQGLVDEALVHFDKKLGKETFSLSVRYLAPGDPPIVGGELVKQSKAKKRGGPVASGKTYWDVIYGMCVKHGRICYVRGTDLIITTPQDFTATASVAAELGQAALVALGLAHRPITVAYGRNLSKLEMERHLGKEMVPTVTANSYDPSTQQNISVSYPEGSEDVDEEDVPTTGVGTKKKEEVFISPGDNISLAQLRDYAKAYYDNLARAEGKVKFSTRDLVDLDGQDLFLLRPGNPVQIGFDAFNEALMRQMTEAQREEYLVEQGYSDEVAVTVARCFENVNRFQAPFYTKSIQWGWSIEGGSGGLSLDVEAQNYIVPARDAADAQK